LPRGFFKNKKSLKNVSQKNVTCDKIKKRAVSGKKAKNILRHVFHTQLCCLVLKKPRGKTAHQATKLRMKNVSKKKMSHVTKSTMFIDLSARRRQRQTDRLCNGCCRIDQFIYLAFDDF
jgi:hypothetical protein